MIKNLPAMQVQSLGWRREWQSTPVFLHGQRSLVGCSSQDHKESDTTEGLTIIYFLRETMSVTVYFVSSHEESDSFSS